MYKIKSRPSEIEIKRTTNIGFKNVSDIVFNAIIFYLLPILFLWGKVEYGYIISLVLFIVGALCIYGALPTEKFPIKFLKIDFHNKKIQGILNDTAFEKSFSSMRFVVKKRVGRVVEEVHNSLPRFRKKYEVYVGIEYKTQNSEKQCSVPLYNYIEYYMVKKYLQSFIDVAERAQVEIDDCIYKLVETKTQFDFANYFYTYFRFFWFLYFVIVGGVMYLNNGDMSVVTNSPYWNTFLIITAFFSLTPLLILYFLLPLQILFGNRISLDDLFHDREKRASQGIVAKIFAAFFLGLGIYVLIYFLRYYNVL